MGLVAPPNTSTMIWVLVANPISWKCTPPIPLVIVGKISIYFEYFYVNEYSMYEVLRSQVEHFEPQKLLYHLVCSNKGAWNSQYATPEIQPHSNVDFRTVIYKITYIRQKCFSSN